MIKFIIVTNSRKFYTKTSLQNFVLLKSCIDYLSYDIIPIKWDLGISKNIPFRIQKECESLHIGEYDYSKSVREMIDFLQIKKLYYNFKHSKDLMDDIISPFPETISQIRHLYNRKLDFNCAIFTLFDPYTFYNLLIAFYIKRNNPNIKIILGGTVINNSVAVRNFLSTFEGIEVKQGNIEDITYNDVSVPTYDKKYNSVTDGLVTISSSRGCPYNCSFCSSNNSFDKMEIDKFINWIDINQMLDHNKKLLINDPTVNFSEKRFNELLDGMIHIKNRLSTFVWLEGININADIINKMRKANITEVFYGTDVFHETLKNKINKKSNSIIETINLLKVFQKNKIQVHTNMIYGFPQETREEFEHNFNAGKEISKYTKLTHSLFFLLPGSPMYNNPKKHGITLEYWDDTDITRYAIFEPNKKEIDYRCRRINESRFYNDTGK